MSAPHPDYGCMTLPAVAETAPLTPPVIDWLEMFTNNLEKLESHIAQLLGGLATKDQAEAAQMWDEVNDKLLRIYGFGQRVFETLNNCGSSEDTEQLADAPVLELAPVIAAVPTVEEVTLETTVVTKPKLAVEPDVQLTVTQPQTDETAANHERTATVLTKKFELPEQFDVRVMEVIADMPDGEAHVAVIIKNIFHRRLEDHEFNTVKQAISGMLSRRTIQWASERGFLTLPPASLDGIRTTMQDAFDRADKSARMSIDEKLAAAGVKTKLLKGRKR